MIVILCDSFDDAKEVFEIFLEYLNRECYVIKQNFKACYCVETDDDLRYIFIDYRMRNIFKDMTPDFLDVEEFFEGLPNYYDSCGCRGYDG